MTSEPSICCTKAVNDGDQDADHSAILDPQFISGAEASEQMVDSERVLGVSINGDHRAYPLNLLSRHEIVNDEVGGVPVAVTW